MNWIKNIVILFISSCVAIVLAEILARKIEINSSNPRYGYPVGLFTPDQTLGVRLTPNFNGVHHFEDLSYSLNINSLGCFEDDKKVSANAMLILGDSHTFGYVEKKDRYSDVLHETYGYESYNCAVTGTSTEYQRLQFQWLYNNGIKPKRVILGYLPYNDVEGDILFPQYTAMLGVRLDKKIFDPDLQVVDAKQYKAWKVWLVSDFALVRMALRARINLKRYFLEERSSARPNEFNRLIFRLDDKEDYFQQHLENLKQFKRDLDSLNIDFFVYVIPVTEITDHEASIEYSDAVNFIVSEMKAYGISVISDASFGKNSHHPLNGHMDRRGHNIVASKINEYFVDHCIEGDCSSGQ